MTNSVSDLFNGTDFSLLQKQRLELTKLIHFDDTGCLLDKCLDALKGIENFLDAFVDTALAPEGMNMPKYLVYPDREYKILGPFEDYANQVVRIVGPNPGSSIEDDIWEVRDDSGKSWYVEGERLERIDD